MKRYITVVAIVLSITSQAQSVLKISISDRSTHLPVPLVTIITDSTLVATADTAGRAQLNLSNGLHGILFTITGYKKLDTTLTISGNEQISVSLETEDEQLEEVTIVASTRNNQNIENSPMKVEVLGREEVSEEVSIKPGNIASMLGDVSGVQVQQLSAATGNSNVRIQGLDGRYTQILRDGMPLYDGFSGGFGILTIPPLDLKQIELIKGAASTLYGGGAIGGLVNLITKSPTQQQTIDAMVNYTTLNELNANLYLSKRYKKAGYTLFAGYTNQQANDVNGDGFSDVPNISSVLIHPGIFFYPSSHSTLSFDYSLTYDERKGGDMQVISGNADLMHSYFEQIKSMRHTLAYHYEHRFAGNILLTIKGTGSNFDQATTTNTYDIKGNQTSYYNEVSALVPMGRNNLVAGLNIVGDNYSAESPPPVLQSRSNFTVGAFAQYSLHIKEKTTIEAGMRLDDHKTYGLFALPRIAVFHRFSTRWACRAGFGMGYKTPNPLQPQVIEYDPRLLALPHNDLNPELSYGYNAEANYKKEWDNGLSLFINHAFFLTRLEHPILFTQNNLGIVTLSNAGRPIITEGFDTYVKLSVKSWELYLGYTYTDARNTYLPANISFVPLTPRNRSAAVLTREIKKLWRVGVEGSYTGPQYRYDMTSTPGYLFMALMVQRNIGRHITLVANCENLLDYRMSLAEALYTGTITNPSFKPLWAPIDGRVVNLSVRWKL